MYSREITLYFSYVMSNICTFIIVRGIIVLCLYGIVNLHASSIVWQNLPGLPNCEVLAELASDSIFPYSVHWLLSKLQYAPCIPEF